MKKDKRRIKWKKNKIHWIPSSEWKKEQVKGNWKRAIKWNKKHTKNEITKNVFQGLRAHGLLNFIHNNDYTHCACELLFIIILSFFFVSNQQAFCEEVSWRLTKFQWPWFFFLALFSIYFFLSYVRSLILFSALLYFKLNL